MIRQRADTDNYVGITVFLLLFFFMICAVSGNSDTAAGRTHHYISVSVLHSQISALNDAQQAPVQKNVIRVLEKTNFKVFSDCNRIVADNRLIHHNILFLQKTELLIKPVVLHRFYFLYHVHAADDLPVLS
jgi:hypothetical protein